MDFRNFKQSDGTETKQRQPRAPGKSGVRWWTEPDAKLAAEYAWAQQKALEESQSYRMEEMVRYARLFGNKDLASLRPSQYAKPTSADSHSKSTSTNVVKSGIETVVSMTTSARPRPSYLTDGGDFGQREKAKLLNKFTRGQFLRLPTLYVTSAMSAEDVVKMVK